jgi:uncharacterized protein (TIGR04255 family)
MADREVFDNAPLRLVSLELRYPVTSRVLTRKVWDAFEQALRWDLPKVDVLASDAETYVPTGMYDAVLRRSTDDRRRAVTLHAGAVTVELADYRHYEDLLQLARPTFDAMDALSDDLVCTHMGLRYINEIPAAAVDPADGKVWGEPAFWASFVNDELLRTPKNEPGGLCTFGYRARLMMHAVSETDLSHVSLEYGPHPSGLSTTDGALEIGSETGPCFTLDIDTYAPGSTQEPIASDREQALGVLDRLHDAAESTFHWSITERLKEEVFRAPVQGDDREVRHAADA